MDWGLAVRVPTTSHVRYEKFCIFWLWVRELLGIFLSVNRKILRIPGLCSGFLIVTSLFLSWLLYVLYWYCVCLLMLLYYVFLIDLLSNLLPDKESEQSSPWVLADMEIVTFGYPLYIFFWFFWILLNVVVVCCGRFVVLSGWWNLL
jgi:hypothetical protein